MNNLIRIPRSCLLQDLLIFHHVGNVPPKFTDFNAYLAVRNAKQVSGIHLEMSSVPQRPGFSDPWVHLKKCVIEVRWSKERDG